MPFEYVEKLSEYKGGFVSSSEGFLRTDLVGSSCIFEIYSFDELLTELESSSSPPEWMMPGVDLEGLFQKYLNSNELEKAWFTLNNDQWEPSQINVGLKKLQDVSDNRLFQLLANSWRSHFGFI